MPAPTVILRLLKGDAQEMAELQHVLEAAPTYAERITGAPPGSADAQSIYSVLPPDKGYEDKFVLGVYLEDVMIGCVDLIAPWSLTFRSTGCAGTCLHSSHRPVGAAATFNVRHRMKPEEEREIADRGSS